MRDLAAALVALLLLMVAASLATTLRTYRRRRQRARDSERALGRTVIAELPIGDDLVLVSEDDKRFYYGDAPIDKDLIVAVRLLINGAPIAASASRRYATGPTPPPTSFEDRPEGIARDRWDVAVETRAGTTLIELAAVCWPSFGSAVTEELTSSSLLALTLAPRSLPAASRSVVNRLRLADMRTAPASPSLTLSGVLMWVSLIWAMSMLRSYTLTGGAVRARSEGQWRARSSARPTRPGWGPPRGGRPARGVARPAGRSTVPIRSRLTRPATTPR